jgi:hypothetical protein
MWRLPNVCYCLEAKCGNMQIINNLIKISICIAINKGFLDFKKKKKFPNNFSTSLQKMQLKLRVEAYFVDINF